MDTSNLNSVNSTSVQTMLKQGWSALKNNQINDAIRISQSLNQQYPDHSEAWYYTAQVALALHNNVAAEQALKNACKLAPKNQTVNIILANFYFSKNDFQQAKKLAFSLNEKVLKAAEHNQLAFLFSKLSLTEESINQYRMAIALDAKNNDHYYSLAAVLRHAGELISAEENLNKAIELNPLDIDSHVLKVDLKKQTHDHHSIDSLITLLDEDLAPKDKVQVYFALAKSYEDLADYEKSYVNVEQGNNLRRKHLNYAIETDQQTMTKISQIFNEAWWQKDTVESADKNEQALTPIFVLGMPRTGSTLTDRILTASDDVFSGGELNDFAQLLTEQVNQLQTSSKQEKTPFIEAASQIDFKQLGQTYLSTVKARFSEVDLGGSIGFFTDKLPFNYLYLGLIKKALPNAKIIHITRHPMDTCYAIYKTLFQQAYPFSYDLKELGQYFIQYQKLMKHWYSLSNMDIHQVSYEKLVSSPIETGQALYQFCGLEWQDKFVEVKNHQGAVNTASASQVRQKIHKNSVQKWRQYEQQLAPLKAQLQQVGICCD
jgi:tetratricopeptide (TPR) repeat protein